MTPGDTDWARIAGLYDELARLVPSPVVQLNRAVAVGMAVGPEAGLELVDALTETRRVAEYHLLPSVRGDLLSRLGRTQEARAEFARAAQLVRNIPERDLLMGGRPTLSQRRDACRQSNRRATSAFRLPSSVSSSAVRRPPTCRYILASWRW